MQDDVDEKDMIRQVKEKIPDAGPDDSLMRKIYRQRVVNVAGWEDINQEKIGTLPTNLIPQRQAKMDQVYSNNLNDSWNEPTIIQVIIVADEFVPNSFEYIHDSFTMAPVVLSQKVTITSKNLHPDNPYNWQFGIDRLAVQNFIHAFLNLVR